MMLLWRSAIRAARFRRVAWIPIGIAVGTLFDIGFRWFNTPVLPKRVAPLRVHYSFPPEITNSNVVLSHVFDVRNPSDQVVRIVDMQASCGCTSAALGTRTLGPGESTELNFSARVPLAETSEKLAVQLQTDLPQQPVWIYSVSVDRYSPITFLPKQLLLGERAPGAEVEAPLHVEVHRFDDKPVGLPRFEFGRNLEGFSTVPEGGPVVTKLADGVVRTTISLQLQGTVGTTQGQQWSHIQMHLEGFTQGTGLSIPVQWSVQGPISVSPLRVFFGNNGNGKTRTRRALLASADGTPFRIVGLKTPSPMVRAVVAAESKASKVSVARNGQQSPDRANVAWEQVEVEISLDPGFAEKFLRGNVVVITDHPDNSEVQIGVTAIRPTDSNITRKQEAGT